MRDSGLSPLSPIDNVMVEDFERVCLGCGQVLPSHIARATCSDRCAQREQRERRARRRRSRRLFCAVCYEAFIPSRHDAQFCSPACRQRAYRRRKATKLSRDRKSADLIASLIG